LLYQLLVERVNVDKLILAISDVTVLLTVTQSIVACDTESVYCTDICISLQSQLPVDCHRCLS